MISLQLKQWELKYLGATDYYGKRLGISLPPIFDWETIAISALQAGKHCYCCSLDRKGPVTLHQHVPGAVLSEPRPCGHQSHGDMRIIGLCLSVERRRWRKGRFLISSMCSWLTFLSWIHICDDFHWHWNTSRLLLFIRRAVNQP